MSGATTDSSDAVGGVQPDSVRAVLGSRWIVPREGEVGLGIKDSRDAVAEIGLANWSPLPICVGGQFPNRRFGFRVGGHNHNIRPVRRAPLNHDFGWR